MAKVGGTPPPDDDDIVDGQLVGELDDELDDDAEWANGRDGADELNGAEDPQGVDDYPGDDVDSGDLDDDESDGDESDGDNFDGEFEDGELDEDAALVPANRRVRGRAGIMDKELTARNKDVNAKDLKTKDVKNKDVRSKAKADSRSARAGRDGAAGPAAWFQSAVRFLREIVAEMRKVIWPSRQELITYTIVVVIFVVILVSIVAGLDIGFAKLTLWVFG